MNYAEISELLQQSATVRLYRSDYAPVILAFFVRVFRTGNQLVVAEADLVEQLADFLEDIDFLEPVEGANETTSISYHELKARQLVGRWCDHGFLRNYLGSKGETLYELSLESEKALQWLDLLQKQDFVGTESRFKDIVSRLRDLVENTHSDPDQRLAELAAKKQRIEQEMARIESEQSVRSFDDYQIKSRFLEINRLAQQLLSDFREVEDNFRSLTRDIYHRHMELRGGKGQILRYAFDALESLKSTDQGKSFYAFWDFLLVSSGQRELQELTEQVYGLLRERNIEQADGLLRHLRTSLHQAAQKVLDSNDRMAERLSRIIMDTDPQETRQMKETMGRIKELAVQLARHDFSRERFLTLELDPEVRLPMERRLALEPEEPIFLEQPDSGEGWEDPPEALEYLFNAFFVDKEAIRDRIEALLDEHPDWTLADVLNRHPIHQGLPEVFAYLTLASRRGEGGIGEPGPEGEGRMLIPFDYENNRALLMPEVRFRKS
ncbi:MAG: DUF3375 domain-containing protein [Candidatus Sericytochromatia bacterium]